jgi:protein SCO1
MIFTRTGSASGSVAIPRLRVGLTDLWLFCMVVVIASAGSAAAQGPAVYGPANVRLGQVVDQSKLPAGLDGVGIEQKLDAPVPPELTFVDDTGKQVRLGDYFGARPVILVLAYFRCPMLCTQVLNGVADRLRFVRLEPGKDFEIVCVSFDPSDTPALAAAKKASYIEHYNRPETAGAWHFLTGDQQSIDQLTRAVGFNYRFDPTKSQFAHGSTVMLVTPAGRLSRYFMGLAYSARDLQLGLVEAAHGQIGSPVQQLMLYCFSFDGASGKYTLSILNLVRAGGALTIFLLCNTFFVAWRRTRQHQAGAPSTAN